jgi:hypothetical protein
LLVRTNAKAAAVTFRSLSPHAAAVIDNQANCHRDIVMLKYPNILRLAILKHTEIFLLKPGNRPGSLVAHADMQDD